MGIDYEALKFWWMVAVTFGNVGAIIFTWISTKDKSNELLAKECITKLNSFETRMVKIETEIEHMPSSTEIAELQADMQGLKSDVKSISSSLTGMHRQLEMINQHLLNNHHS